MVTAESPVKLTYEDYRNTPEDERYELLDGELVMSEAPRIVHQRANVKLVSRMERFVEEGDLGEVFHAPTDVVLSETAVVQPDLLFVSNERMHVITPAGVQGAPDLVVEILSPATAERDRGYKRALYARNGVKEYWIVGTDAGVVTVLLLGDDGYEVVDTFGEGDTLTSPTLEGFELKVDDVFV